MSIDLRVPDSRVESFLILSRMTEDAYKELFSQVAKIKPPAYSDQLIHQLSCESKLTPKKDFAEVIRTILSLFPPMISSRKPVSAFIEDLMTALTANAKIDESLTKENFGTLQTRLNTLLKIPSLSVNAKATSVYFENAKSYISSRVLSDIRPVFGLEDDSISGMVLIHTLKLEYVEDNSDTKEIYLAMDEAEIDDLISKLQREKIKIEKIRATLANGPINIIDLDNK